MNWKEVQKIKPKDFFCADPQPRSRSKMLEVNSLFVGWLLNVPAACSCISGTDLLRQFYVLPHWDRSCKPNFPSHPVTVFWHRADQSQCWPYNARRLAGQPLECQFLSHWYDSTPKKSRRNWDSNPGSSALEAGALPLGQRGGRSQQCL